MPKMTKKYISWMLSALMCFNSSFIVTQAEDPVQTEEPEILEVAEEQPEEIVQETVEEEQIEVPSDEEIIHDENPEEPKEQLSEEIITGDETGDAENEIAEDFPQQTGTPAEDITETELIPEESAVIEDDFDEENELSDSVTEETEITDEGEPAEEGEVESIITASCGDNLTWSYSKNTLTISGYGDMDDFSEGTAPWAQYKDTLKTVIVKSGVTSIGDYAFSNFSALTKVTLPDDLLSIGSYAFNLCFRDKSATYTFNMPSKLEYVGDYAFYCDQWLPFKSAVLPAELSYIGSWAFANCLQLKGKLVIPEGITVVEHGAFSYNRWITGIELPSSLKRIGVEGFAGFGLDDDPVIEQLIIPDSVERIDSEAFRGVHIKSLIIGKNVKYIGVAAFSDTVLEKVVFRGNAPGTAANSNVFSSEPLIVYYPADDDTWTDDAKNRISENGWTPIIWKEQGADYEDSCGDNLTWKYQNKILTVSGKGEMYDFSSEGGAPWADHMHEIETVIVKDGVTSIGDYAFMGLSNVVTISLPDSIRYIGDHSIAHCSTQYTDVHNPFHLPDHLIYIGDYAFDSSSYLSFDSAELPQSLEYIGAYAFRYCYRLIGKLIIPEGITKIENYSFISCSGLTDIQLPPYLEEIGEGSFQYARNIKTIIIPDTVTRIEALAFYYGEYEKVVIGRNVEWIGRQAFDSQTLTDVYFLGDPPKHEYFVYYHSNAFAYYPEENTLWTQEIRDEIGENFAYVTWVADSLFTEVTLVLNDEGDTEIIEVLKDSVFAKPQVDGPEGYYVSGWYTSPRYTESTKWNFNKDKARDNLILYAKWEPIKVVDVYLLELEDEESILIEKGQTYQLEYVIEPEDALNQNVTWSSSDNKVASVDENGLVTGLSNGTATITITTEDGDHSASIEVAVVVKVKGITLSDDQISIAIRDQYELTAVIEPEDAYNQTVLWSSSDEDVVTVDENGIVTAVSEGTAVITAETKDGGYTDTCTVTSYTVFAEGITVNDEESVSELEFGRNGTIKITFEPSNTTNQKLGWSSSDEKIAVVDENGIITAVGEGSVTITATSEDGGFTASKTIDVFYNHIEKVAFAEEATETVIGKTRSLIILFTPENASNKAVTYVSSNEDIATVDKEGVVTGISEGTAEITVTTEDGNHIAVCIVRVMPNGVYIKGLADSYTYTGSAFKPEIQIYDSGILLTPITDYTITYKNNTKAYTLTEDDSEFIAKKAPQIILKSNSKGNYKGSKTIYFTIEPLDINDEQITVDELSAQAGTKPISPVPVVYFNGKKLKNKTDFTVDYNGWNQMDSGDITIKIHGKGNFQGTRDVTVHVAAQGMTSVAKLKVTSGSVRYTDLTGDFMTDFGSRITVKDGNTTLLKDVEYEIIEDSAKNCDQIGTCTFTIQGKGKYYGKRTVSVKITGTSMTDKKIKTVIPVYQYTGQEIELDENFAVLYDGEVLQKGVDYVVDDYANNVNAGKASAVLKGINRFTGTKKVTYTIAPVSAQLNENQISVSEAVYEKSGAKAQVKIEGMTEGVDYIVKYKYNTKANTYGTAEITFKGNYKGTASVKRQFFIQPKDISGISIAAKDKVYSAKANAWKSTPVLKDTDGKTLKAGTDYDKNITYTTEDGEELHAVVEAGTVVLVTVTGKGNYTGTAETFYRILESGKDISKATFKITQKEYTGSLVTLTEADITATINKTTPLKLGTDFVIDGYTNNLKKGTAKVTFRGINGYGGTKTVSFKIGQRSIVDYWNGIKSFFSTLF
ncbi:MAG: leucine-rich repeat protein [Solobacterium sp.]|nr:leucine-rich repeat protein [Solobacterium sp.]